jgi:subtilisin-like proprotein convertase family protein
MKRTRRSRLALIGVLALALSVTVGLMAGAADAKKKKKKPKGGTVTVSRVLNQPIPDATPGPDSVDGKVPVTLAVGGKKVKKKVVSTVQVTLQTTGDSPIAAGDLAFRLIAPNGRATFVGPTFGGLGGQSIGPLTLSANSPVGTCNTDTPPCANPDQTLNRPFAGTAGDVNLALFEGVPATGNWTFVAYDVANADTSILNSVQLAVSAVPKPS